MKILLATDGRVPALEAERLLCRLADPERTEIAIVHALGFGNGPVGDAHAAEVLGDAGDRLRAARLETTEICLEGDPAAAIEDELGRRTYGLVVMGAGNHTWLGGLVFGSVSARLMRVAPSPVLIVHRGPVPDHDRVRVLVGTDGSLAAMRSVETLIGLTDPSRVDIAVRTVVPALDVSFAAYPGAAVPLAYLDQDRQEARETAARTLEHVLERLHRAGFAATGSVGSGWPGADLLDQVDHDEMDLAVVGGRDLGRIERLAMGSVSEHVARHASATLVAHAIEPTGIVEPVGDPNGHVERSRYAVRWR